ncbi:MAG: tetratricopeptide repeat protein [Verrucomicrobiales bacterium]|nr:tetratricopeptide repeat protein [Verrucomicrobiales bacterium]
MSSELSHGLLLLEQGRLEDAESCFIGLLAREPENDFVHSRLAVCRMQQPGRKKDALESIENAIQLRPDDDYYHGLKSLILSGLYRSKEALESADLAISMNPDSSFNYGAKAAALCELHRWAEAEENCRVALSIDPYDSNASHILTNVLRLQGKSDENQLAVDVQLSENPESAYAHLNAGWAALQKRDHRKAEEHFREALRLDSSMDSARTGLIESFKARSWFYRMYLSYCFFMQRFTGKGQWGIIIGAYIAYQLLRVPLRQIGGKWAEFTLIGLWLTLILWIWLAPGIGNFLICLDRSARRALLKSEVIHGLWIGISLIVGIPLLAYGILRPYIPFTPLGAMFLASTIPATMTFSNESRKGRLVFGGILALVLGCGIVSSAIIFSAGVNTERAENLLVTMIVVSALSTWLGNVPALRRDDSG